MTVKTWTFAYNTVPEDQTTHARQVASLHKQRKDFLVAGGWTVTRSSDGDAGRTDFTGDNVTDIATDFIWSSSGARTWMELKSPEGFYAGLDGTYTGDQSRMWVTIHLNSDNVYSAEIYFHNVVPTGTADATHCPTSTNKIGYAAQQMLRSAFNPVYPAIFHFIRTSEGSWCEFVGYYGSGIMPYALIAAPMTNVNHNPVLNKDYPFTTAIYAGWRDSDRGALSWITWESTGGNQSSNSVPNGYFWKTWYKDGTTVTDTRPVFLAESRLYYSNISTSSFSTAYPLGTNFTWASRDMFSFDFPTTPILMIVNSSGRQTRIGEIADIFGTAAAIVQGDVDDATNPTKVFIGNMVFPTDTMISII